MKRCSLHRTFGLYRLCALAAAMLLLLSSLTACSGAGSSAGGGASIPETEAAAAAQTQETAASAAETTASGEIKKNTSAAESTEAEKAETKEEKETEEAAETAPSETVSSEASSSEEGETHALFESMDGIIFGFMSGVGAWETTLEVAADGTFTGQFYDSNMGEDGEGYPNGTLYECSFTGSFAMPERLTETSWSTKVLTLEYEKEKDGKDSYIEEGVRHVLAEPYGLSDAAEIVIYTPGQKIDELSEEFMSWMIWRLPENTEALPEMAIFNATDALVFYPDQWAMGTYEEEGTASGQERRARSTGRSGMPIRIRRCHLTTSCHMWRRCSRAATRCQSPTRVCRLPHSRAAGSTAIRMQTAPP